MSSHESNNPSSQEEESGLRQDLLAYLLGEIEITELNPYTKKELMACFTELESRDLKSDKWRNNFSIAQRSPKYQDVDQITFRHFLENNQEDS